MTNRRSTSGRARRATVVLVCSAALGAVIGPWSAADASTRPPLSSGDVRLANTPAWVMHPITTRLRLNNGLGTAFVDGDRRPDFVSAEEGDSRYAVVLGARSNPSRSASWRTVELLPKTSAPAAPGTPPAICVEYATLADLDGDGHPDVVGAQGAELGEGNEPGIRVFWGPAPADAGNRDAWSDAGRIPSTVDVGHFERVEAADMNGDRVPDLVVGGRTLYTTGRNAGIGWVSAPVNRTDRRDLAKWQFHSIDPAQPGGYGFTVADLDRDGRPDLVLANADQDTPQSARQLVWYRNPGPAAIERPWPERVIASLPDLGKKAQVAVGDLGDGHISIVTSIPGSVLIYQPNESTRNRSATMTFRRVVLHQPPALSGLSTRMVKITDIDRDGRPDLVLGFGHDDDASIPVDKAAVAWIGRAGKGADAPWVAHVVRWGAGRTMGIISFGEKWQIAVPADVNGDGRTDVVADNQEWWVDPSGEFGDWTTPDPKLEGVGIVWFEQPARRSVPACRERNGACSFEAERPTAQLDGTWVERDLYPGAVGAAYLQDFNALDTVTRCSRTATPAPADCRGADDGLAVSATRGAGYDVRLEGGTYAVWARVLAPAPWASTPAGQGGRRPSAWVSIGGREQTIAASGALDTWTWVRVIAPVDLNAGSTRVVMRARDGGIAVDRLLMTRNLTSTLPAELSG